MDLFEKELVVLGVTPAIETRTGDPIYLVSLGEMLDRPPDLVPAPVTGQRQQRLPNKVPASWLSLNIKAREIPYTAGSRWKLTVSSDGSMKLAKMD
jgi:hypothetical protein